MEFEVIVQPKKEVLEPEGRSIQKTLARIGFSSLSEVHVSKRYLLRINAEQCPNPEQQAFDIAQKHLANPVAETFQIKRL